VHVVLVALVKLSFEGLVEVDVVLVGRTARASDVTAAGFASPPGRGPRWQPAVRTPRGGSQSVHDVGGWCHRFGRQVERVGQEPVRALDITVAVEPGDWLAGADLLPEADEHLDAGPGVDRVVLALAPSAEGEGSTADAKRV
jgi:hypothetical protein